MRLRITLCLVLFLNLLSEAGYAQADSLDIDRIEEKFEPKPHKFYWSNALDAAIFSTSTYSYPGKSSQLSTLRFSYFFNFGFNFNYDFSNHVGLYTGVGIKNIGYIEQIKAVDSTIKRRVYTIGVPLGIKIGNIKRRNYVMLGGGVDIPFNYKEKGFVKRGNKEKFNEWFSDRTTLLMPYVFVGGSFAPGISLKLQYYPGNFMNTDYQENMVVGGVPTMVKPYAGYNVNLVLLSLGMDIHYKGKSKMKHLFNK
ncbi:MAG: hypothetical protein ACTHKV_12850 [Flavipsychrobacter sp.]